MQAGAQAGVYSATQDRHLKRAQMVRVQFDTETFLRLWDTRQSDTPLSKVHVQSACVRTIGHAGAEHRPHLTGSNTHERYTPKYHTFDTDVRI